jgi:hypothetical protein
MLADGGYVAFRESKVCGPLTQSQESKLGHRFVWYWPSLASRSDNGNFGETVGSSERLVHFRGATICVAGPTRLMQASPRHRLDYEHVETRSNDQDEE